MWANLSALADLGRTQTNSLPGKISAVRAQVSERASGRVQLCDFATSSWLLQPGLSQVFRATITTLHFPPSVLSVNFIVEEFARLCNHPVPEDFGGEKFQTFPIKLRYLFSFSLFYDFFQNELRPEARSVAGVLGLVCWFFFREEISLCEGSPVIYLSVRRMPQGGENWKVVQDLETTTTEPLAAGSFVFLALAMW